MKWVLYNIIELYLDVHFNMINFSNVSDIYYFEKYRNLVFFQIFIVIFWFYSMFCIFQILVSLIFPFMIPFIKFSTKESIVDSTETAPAPKPSSDPMGVTGGQDDNPRNQQKLYSVRMFSCCKSDENTVSFWKAIYYFHHSPIVKFCYHTVSTGGFYGILACPIHFF